MIFISKFLLLIFLFYATPINAELWDDTVASYIEAYEKSAKNSKPMIYPQLADRVKHLFQLYEKVHILISINSEEKGGYDQMDLFYQKGELHIVQHRTGWNLTTKGEYLFEWETGKDTGIKIKKNEQDIVAYIYYLTDPSLIMTSIYKKYLDSPWMFNENNYKNSSWKKLVFKEPLYGIKSISITGSPLLWFFGYEVLNLKTNKLHTIHISKPKKVSKIPSEVLKRSEKIQFIESENTLKRHLNIL